MKYFVTCFVVSIFIGSVSCLEKELTIIVEPGRRDCYYQDAVKGQTIDIEYQVIDGAHGELDITFTLIDPIGRILKHDSKKGDNNHREVVERDGDYRFCFDNTMTSFNSKTVFIELIVENDGSDEEVEDKYDGFRPEDVYELTVQEIHDSIAKVRNHITKVRHLQELIKTTEARDRNIAEENYHRVNTFAPLQLVVMLVVSLTQVFVLKSLFDEQSRIYKFWKKLERQVKSKQTY